MNWLKALEPPVRLRIRVRINNFEAVAVVDTGAAISKISTSLARKIGAIRSGMSGLLRHGRTNRTSQGEIVTANIQLPTIDGCLFEKEIFLWRSQHGVYELLLGIHFLDQFDFEVNFRDHCLILSERHRRVQCDFLSAFFVTAAQARMCIDKTIFTVKQGIGRLFQEEAPSELRNIFKHIKSELAEGCSISVIKLSAIKDLAAITPPSLLSRMKTMGTPATSGVLAATLVVGDSVDDTFSFDAELYVTQSCGCDMIIGGDILQRFSCQVMSQHLIFDVGEERQLKLNYFE